MAFLQKKKISYTTIVYGSYTPEEFHKRLSQSKFCVWVGRHESQGHAFQQCLSMNVPMFVVDVQSMKEELYNQEYLYANMKEKLLATAAPYFDYRCGKINRTRETLEGDFKEFQDNLVSYRPREYALEVLSDEACFRRLCIAFDLNK
jgi:hypothetical protein